MPKTLKESNRKNLFSLLKLCFSGFVSERKDLYNRIQREWAGLSYFHRTLKSLVPKCLPFCIKYLLESGLFQIKVLMKSLQNSSPLGKKINENNKMPPPSVLTEP